MLVVEFSEGKQPDMITLLLGDPFFMLININKNNLFIVSLRSLDFVPKRHKSYSSYYWPFLILSSIVNEIDYQRMSDSYKDRRPLNLCGL